MVLGSCLRCGVGIDITVDDGGIFGEGIGGCGAGGGAGGRWVAQWRESVGCDECSVNASALHIDALSHGADEVLDGDGLPLKHLHGVGGADLTS